MKKLLKENKKELVKLLATIIVLSIISILLSRWLRTDVMQEKILQTGIWGPVIAGLYIVFSHVFAPVAGTPGVVVAFAGFGLFKGWLILYIASLLSATINFYIARKLGRNWVIKLAGRDSIDKIDKFTEIMGTKLLIIARIFGMPMFEFISYAVGLSNISFEKYFLITSTIIIIPGYIFSVLINNSLESASSLALFFLGMFVLGALFSWYIVREYLKFKTSRKA